MQSHQTGSMKLPLQSAFRICPWIGGVTCVLLVTQGCASRTPSQVAPGRKATPAVARTIRISDGGKVTVEPTKTAWGEKAQLVYVYDRNGQQTGMSWCTDYTGSFDQLVSMSSQLQQAVATNNRWAVARLVRFPLVVNGGRSESISSAGMLLKRYDQVFTPSVTKAILKKDPRSVFCTADGATSTDGVVWITTRDGRTAIEVVNR